MTDTEKWVGRPASELAAEASTPTGLYCWLRAGGKTAEAAVAEIAHRSGFTAGYNVERLARQCARAEERERERAAGPPAPANTFIPEAQGYRLARARGASRREAVEQVAKHFGHGRANRPALEKRLGEVEQAMPKNRPTVDLDAIEADATARLPELEQVRIRLAADALVDSEVRDEYEQVEREIQGCRRTLEMCSIARSGQPEKAAA